MPKFAPSSFFFSSKLLLHIWWCFFFNLSFTFWISLFNKPKCYWPEHLLGHVMNCMYQYFSVCHYHANGCTFADGVSYHRQCYHVENRTMSWIQAKVSFFRFLFRSFQTWPLLKLFFFSLNVFLQQFCESQCAHLATFSDSGEMNHILLNLARHHVLYGHGMSNLYFTIRFVLLL